MEKQRVLKGLNTPERQEKDHQRWRYGNWSQNHDDRCLDDGLELVPVEEDKKMGQGGK